MKNLFYSYSIFFKSNIFFCNMNKFLFSIDKERLNKRFFTYEDKFSLSVLKLSYYQNIKN